MSVCMSNDKFMNNSYPTIGVDFFIKIIPINDENIKLQMWDTTGQEKYNSITTSFYRNAKFIFLMFCISSYISSNTSNDEIPFSKSVNIGVADSI